VLEEPHPRVVGEWNLLGPRRRVRHGLLHVGLAGAQNHIAKDHFTGGDGIDARDQRQVEGACQNKTKTTTLESTNATVVDGAVLLLQSVPQRRSIVYRTS
jgi:hypothetical protein